MIDEVERQENLADVYDEILDSSARDDHEQLARKRRVEEELAALRKKAKQE